MNIPVSHIETAEEHLREALKILTVAGVDIVTETGRQWVYQDKDLTAVIHRLERALVQVAPMPYPPESSLPF